MNRFYDLNPCISSYLEKHKIPSWWHQILMTSKKPFVKWVLNGIELRLHQNLTYWPSPTAASEQSLRTIWGAAPRAAVLILPQIKLNLQLSSCASFLVDTRDSQEFSAPPFESISSLAPNLLDGPTFTSIHDYWKNHSFDYMDFFSQMMSLLFNMLSKFVTAFLLSRKHLLISWLQLPSAVIMEP